MLFFFVRHGQPIYNPDQLTPHGRLQAQAAAKRLALFGIDRIFSSSSNRARETAQPTCDLVRKEMTVLDWCNEAHAWNEMSAGDPENGQHFWAFRIPYFQKLFSSEDVRKLGMKWYRHPAFKDIPSFEKGVERVRDEADRLFSSLGYRHDRDRNLYIPEKPTDERVALFAHEGFGMLFMSAVLDIPYPAFSTRFSFGHSGITVLEFHDEGGFVVPRVLQLSNDSHLYREGLPVHYQDRLRF